jgi:hypothetical protein
MYYILLANVHLSRCLILFSGSFFRCLILFLTKHLIVFVYIPFGAFSRNLFFHCWSKYSIYPYATVSRHYFIIKYNVFNKYIINVTFSNSASLSCTLPGVRFYMSQPVGEIRISRYFSRKNVTFRKIALHHGFGRTREGTRLQDHICALC